MKRIFEWWHRIPLWIRAVAGVPLLIVICGAISYAAFVAYVYWSWTNATRPHPCIEGGPGSPAIFSNAGTRLFTFPESATSIDSECLTWQSAGINVWFDMEANESELDALIDSMRWNVRPLTSTRVPPSFGDPEPYATDRSYLFGEYSESLEGVRVWIDTDSPIYRVYVYIWLD